MAELARTPHAAIMSLDEILPLLASPDSGRPLHLDGRAALAEAEQRYEMRAGAPLLLPARLKPFFDGRLRIPFDMGHDPFLQYFLLSSIKQSGERNAPATSISYERHLHRLREFCAGCTGRVLDVGCDDPRVGASVLPAVARYVGLDPFFAPNTGFRLVGVAEYLPFRDACLDAVLFNTSLDHVFDHHRALDEAHRTLVIGGRILVATIAWLHSAELIRDHVHFHHFREFEILGALGRFEIRNLRRYDYKGDAHRYGLYVEAVKTRD